MAERYKVPPIGPVFPQTTAGWRVSSLLAELTEGSGGMIVESTRNDVTHAFAQFMELLRGRYIVEFQRPAHTVAGVSVIDIRCGVPKAFIRSAGTSMPVADPAKRDTVVQQGAVTDNSARPAPLGPVVPVNTPSYDEVPLALEAPMPTPEPVVRNKPPHHETSVDITDEAVPIGAPLTAGTAVK